MVQCEGIVSLAMPCYLKQVIITMFQDIIGKRGYLALSCSLATIPVFGILAFTHVYPVVATLWLGITYSFAAVSIGKNT